MKALVIDDSCIIRELVARLLARVGFSSDEAGDGDHALTQLRRGGPFDLAIVDWHMPNMSGYEFVCKVRSEPRYAGLPLIMMSTEGGADYVAAALEAGANEYLVKPFNERKLREKLRLMQLAAVV